MKKRMCVSFLFTVTGFKDKEVFEVCSVMSAWFVWPEELVKIDMPGLYFWLADPELRVFQAVTKFMTLLWRSCHRWFWYTTLSKSH